MMRKHVGFLALGAAAILSACGDDPVSVGDPLSEAEAAALSEVVFASAFANTASFPQPAVVGGPQAVPVSFSEDVELTGPCELGGTVDIDGSVDFQGDDETEEFSLDYSVTIDHNDCMGMAASSEQVFTLNGAEDINFQFSLSAAQESFELDGSMEGNIAWASEDRSGECLIEVTFSGDASQVGEDPVGSFTFDGEICGNSIESNLTIG